MLYRMPLGGQGDRSAQDGREHARSIADAPLACNLYHCFRSLFSNSFGSLAWSTAAPSGEHPEPGVVAVLRFSLACRALA
jgi:hypothetical protein